MACTKTYATLRIRSAAVQPEEISEILGLAATHERVRNPSSKYNHERKFHFWMFTTELESDSTDSEDHILIIVDLLLERKAAVEKLRCMSCELYITNMWTGNGQGGPSLDVPLLGKLYELRLPIWWDNYFDEGE